MRSEQEATYSTPNPVVFFTILELVFCTFSTVFYTQIESFAGTFSSKHTAELTKVFKHKRIKCKLILTSPLWLYLCDQQQEDAGLQAQHRPPVASTLHPSAELWQNSDEQQQIKSDQSSWGGVFISRRQSEQQLDDNQLPAPLPVQPARTLTHSSRVQLRPTSSWRDHTTSCVDFSK